MLCSQALIALSSLVVTARAFRFTIWLGDKCTISGPNERLSDEQLLVFPQAVDKSGCLKYELMQYGYDQSLIIYPEASDNADEYLAFFLSEDCSGDPLLLSPPASALRERPVAGCSNYAAAGITKMSYRVLAKGTE